MSDGPEVEHATGGPAPGITHLSTKTIASRIVAGDWLATERREYADRKYGDDTAAREQLVESMRREGLEVGGEWDLFVSNQLRRVQLLGVNNPAGQQALGKLAVILLHAFETSIVAFGRPPMPGVPSGTIEPWRFGGDE